MGTWEEESVTVAGAVAAIERATAFTEPLRRRSEGVTMMLWGLITVCVILSNALVDGVYGFYKAGGWRWAVSSFLWVPWAAVGVAGTLAVWRVAEARVGRRDEGRRRSPRVILTWFVLLTGIVFTIAFFPVAGPGASIAILGLLWLGIGGFDVYRCTRTGRRSLATIGVLVCISGAAYVFVSRDWSVEAAWRHFEAVAVLTAGLIPVIVGLAQTLRG